MRVLKKINGHKTTIAALSGVILSWVAGRNLLDADTITLLTSLLTIWTGTAIGHKIVKARKK